MPKKGELPMSNKIVATTSSANRAVGVDVGTMFFQTAENNAAGDVETRIVRNAFTDLEMTDATQQMLDQNNFHYVKDAKYAYVIGDDAMNLARMLPGKVELRRPLQDGVLNAGEDMKMLVLNELIRSTIGKAPDKKSVVCTCVSSPPIDGSANNTFHERRLKGMFENQGWTTVVIEEALAVILSERPTVIEEDGNETPYTGIGISFGAGRVNAVLAYKGVTAVGMSASRSGDWIDKEVAAQINLPVAKVTAYKEKQLDFDAIEEATIEGKDIDDLPFALDSYYEAMLRYVFEMFATKFNAVKSDFDRPLDIVVAGGTSMPKGFIGKLDRVVRALDLPFKIKEVRHSKDPRNAVVKGLLVRAALSAKELTKKDTVSADDILK